jgi:hypothetical protein
MSLLLSASLLSVHESKQAVFNAIQVLLNRLEAKSLFTIKISDHFSNQSTNMSLTTVLLQKLVGCLID